MDNDYKYGLVEDSYDNVDLSFHNSYDSTDEFAGQISYFASRLSPFNNILTIGGSLAEVGYFQGQGLTVTNVDISQAMLDYIAEQEPTTILIKSGIANYQGGPFQAVWACRSLIHVPPSDLDAALQRIHSMLSHKGLFGAVLFTSSTTEIIEEETPELHTSKPGALNYRVLYPPREIEARLVSAGFYVASLEIIADKDGQEVVYVECFKQ